MYLAHACGILYTGLSKYLLAKVRNSLKNDVLDMTQTRNRWLFHQKRGMTLKCMRSPFESSGQCVVPFCYDYSQVPSDLKWKFRLRFPQWPKMMLYNSFMEVPMVKWLSSQEMNTATRVQILDENDCISHSTNTLGKGMNPIILPPAMGK